MLKKKQSSSKNTLEIVKKPRNYEKISLVLINLLKDSGVTVRKEELKRGYGWKAISGSCRVNDEKIVLLDRKLSCKEQVLFLTSKVKKYVQSLPESYLVSLKELEWVVSDLADNDSPTSCQVTSDL